MNLFPCLQWVPLIWKHLCGLSNRNETAVLPYDIIAYILVRLPPEKVFLAIRACQPLLALTRDVLLSRATPVIVYHYFLCGHYFITDTDYNTATKSVQEVKLHFTEGSSTLTETKRIKIDLGNAGQVRSRYYVPILYGSYNGFLLIRNLRYDSLLFIWNPVTQEKVTVIAPHNGYCPRGFYFHRRTNEYRVLFVSLKDDQNYFQYFVLSLRTKSSRRIKGCPFIPRSARNPVFLNDVLYWTIDNSAYRKKHGVYPQCSASFLLFDINSEDFSTMPHPGGQILQEDNFLLNLTEREGLLCLCDASSQTEVVIWVLEDSLNKVWVKIHVIEQPLRIFGGTHPVERLEAQGIFKEEVLLALQWRLLCLCDTQEGTCRDLGRGFPDIKFQVSSACHVNTLNCLHTDSKVYLCTEEKTS